MKKWEWMNFCKPKSLTTWWPRKIFKGTTSGFCMRSLKVEKKIKNLGSKDQQDIYRVTKVIKKSLPNLVNE